MKRHTSINPIKPALSIISSAELPSVGLIELLFSDFKENGREPELI
jgi:hypothetical protein